MRRALETLLPLTLKWANENNVPMAQALAKITSGPAEILGKGSAKGRLTVGAKADVVVFDPSAHWVVGAETLVSAGKNTPFAGYELEGRVAIHAGRRRSPLPSGQLNHPMRWLLAPLRAVVFSAHVLLGIAIVLVDFSVRRIRSGAIELIAGWTRILIALAGARVVAAASRLPTPFGSMASIPAAPGRLGSGQSRLMAGYFRDQRGAAVPLCSEGRNRQVAVARRVWSLAAARCSSSAAGDTQLRR